MKLLPCADGCSWATLSSLPHVLLWWFLSGRSLDKRTVIRTPKVKWDSRRDLFGCLFLWFSPLNFWLFYHVPYILELPVSLNGLPSRSPWFLMMPLGMGFSALCLNEISLFRQISGALYSWGQCFTLGKILGPLLEAEVWKLSPEVKPLFPDGPLGGRMSASSTGWNLHPKSQLECGWSQTQCYWPAIPWLGARKRGGRWQTTACPPDVIPRLNLGE